MTCNFSSNGLSPGDSSVVTVTGLSSASANPLNLTVTGKSNTQTTSISLTIFFADFALTATPAGTSVKSGSNAVYTISVSPQNGFNLPVLLSCPPAFPGIPIGATCFWSPPSVVPSGVVGSAVTSTLTITTLAQSRVFPHVRKGPPSGLTKRILLLASIALTIMLLIGLTPSQRWLRPQLSRWHFLLAL